MTSAVENCLFCRIARGEIPSQIVLSDDQVVVIRDIDPKAPVHLLVMPRVHIASLADLNDSALAAHLVSQCHASAVAEGVAGSGYRVVVNTGSDGGQSVGHLHFHVFGGRPLGWPPG